MTFNVKSPTLVTTGCIRHSNKHGRKIKYENLKILLDSGCSHSILAKKYASNKLKEKKQTFTTGNGAMSTKWESKQYFSRSELSRRLDISNNRLQESRIRHDHRTRYHAIIRNKSIIQ